MKHFFSCLSPVSRALSLTLLSGVLLLTTATAVGQGFNVPGGGTPAGWQLNDDPDGGDDVDQINHYRLEAGVDVSLENIVTASYNLAGYTGVTFTVDVSRFGTGANNPLTVEVSTDGGSSWGMPITGSPPTINSYVNRTYNISTVSATTVLRLTNQGTSGRGVRLQNLVLDGTPPAPSATISTGTISGSSFCVGASGAAVSVPYTIGGTYTAGNVFTAQLSDASGSFAAPVSIGTLTSTSAGTIAATIPAATAAGSGYRIRVVSSTPSVTGTDNGTNFSVVNAAAVTVTGLTSNPASGQVQVQWINPTVCFDEVLVIARAGSAVTTAPSGTSYTANAAFGSGSQPTPGEFVVYTGTGTSVTITGLTNGTTYHFSVFSRKGSVYGPAVSGSNTPTAGPSLTEVFVPQYMVARPSTGTTHANRLPYAFRVTLTGLAASTTYRYATRAVLPTDPLTDDGAGNMIHAAPTGNFIRSSATPLTSSAITFTTSATGTYTGWFILEPTANARFIVGNQVKLRILLNDGTASTTVATRLTTASTAYLLTLGTTSADASGIVDTSLATPRNFVLLYDNTAGTGRPLAATYVESDGSANTTANSYTGFYATRVEGRNGKWGTLIPNNNANGVRRIEQRALGTGNIVGCAATDADGVWPSLASTVTPTSGASPVVLSPVDAPLAPSGCGAYVGVDPLVQTFSEGNTGTTTIAIRVTMNTAPAAPVVVQIASTVGGTADPITDYSFSAQTLTFPTSGTYPLTQTVTALLGGDILVEPNETFLVFATVQSGPATSLTTATSAARIVIADDDFLPTGVIINEVSKGPAGQKEYVELLVTGTPGSTVDLRGWTLDDNNGDFSAGPSTGEGISAGHFRFDNHCTWEKVRVGSLIVLFNENDRNATIPPTNDPTDGDIDFVYIVPVRNTGACGAISGSSGYYLDGNCTAPNDASAAYAAASVGPRWSTISLANSGDALQLRQPGTSPTLYHGLSFATSGASQINAVNHPDYATQGANSLFFPGNNQTYLFTNANGNDFRNKTNWTAQAGGGAETPGTPNDLRNAQFIQSLRQPLVPASASASYVCDVRENESRAFLDASNRLMLRLRNQSTTNYGSVTTETVVGGNSQNSNLEGEPLFLGKQYRVTPTTASPADYSITFYVTDAELDSYASYVSAQTGQATTASYLRPRLQIYKNAGSTLVSAATTSSGIQIASAIVATYGSGVTTYTATFTSFSAFALGATIDEVLPVELTRLTATAAPNRAVRVEWATATEKDAEKFEIQRSINGRDFVKIGEVAASGTTTTPQEYQFLDTKPTGGLNYYRLRQVDTDGRAHLTDVVSVRMGAPVAAALEAWPVPMQSELHLRLTAPATGRATLHLYDLQGRAVLTRELHLTAATTELTVPTAALSAGTYVAETRLASGEVVRVKVVK